MNDNANAEVFCLRGTERYACGDWIGAIEEFDRALALQRQCPEAYNNRGFTRQLLSDFEGANADFDEALRLRLNYAEACNNRGLLRHTQENFAGALADFDSALQMNPTYVQAYNNRGVVRLALGEFVKAVADLDRALQLAPSCVEAYVNRCNARRALGDFCGAHADCIVALRLSPRAESASIYHNRGAVYQAQGQLVAALADFDEALNINYLHTPTYNNRGTVRQAFKDYEGALADFKHALELTPKHKAASTYHGLGGVRLMQGNFSGAISEYDKAIEIDPCYWIAYISRANARYHHRDHGGYVDYMKAFRLNPEFTSHEIVRILSEDIEHGSDAVLRNCRIHLRMEPTDIIALARRGLTLLLIDNLEQATTDFAQILSLRPGIKDYLDLLILEANDRRDLKATTTTSPVEKYLDARSEVCAFRP